MVRVLWWDISTECFPCITECFGSSVLYVTLNHLRSLAFTWSEIASIIGVSRVTLYREYGMLDDPSELLTDDQLQQKLRQMRQVYPQFGESMDLRSLGFRVSRERLRNAVHVTDPINRVLRWRGVLTVILSPWTKCFTVCRFVLHPCTV